MYVVGSVVAVAAVGQTLFVIIYLFRPWWRSLVGRAVFFDKLTMALFIDAICLRVLFPGIVSREVAITFYAIAAVAIWFQLFTLIRIMKAKRNEIPKVS